MLNISKLSASSCDSGLHTLSELRTIGLSWSNEACWSSQLLDVRAKSSQLFELTVLQSKHFSANYSFEIF